MLSFRKQSNFITFNKKTMKTPCFQSKTFKFQCFNLVNNYHSLLTTNYLLHFIAGNWNSIKRTCLQLGNNRIVLLPIRILFLAIKKQFYFIASNFKTIKIRCFSIKEIINFSASNYKTDQLHCFHSKNKENSLRPMRILWKCLASIRNNSLPLLKISEQLTFIAYN